MWPLFDAPGSRYKRSLAPHTLDVTLLFQNSMAPVDGGLSEAVLLAHFSIGWQTIAWAQFSQTQSAGGHAQPLEILGPFPVLISMFTFIGRA
jgi:hypothetical protein